jgi:hypothetical protein
MELKVAIERMYKLVMVPILVGRLSVISAGSKTLMKVSATPTSKVPINKLEILKIRRYDPAVRRIMVRAIVTSLPNLALIFGTKGEMSPKQIRGSVVKIPKLVDLTPIPSAILFSIDGIEVMGVLIQAPRRKIPKIKNVLCLRFFKQTLPFLTVK